MLIAVAFPAALIIAVIVNMVTLVVVISEQQEMKLFHAATPIHIMYRLSKISPGTLMKLPSRKSIKVQILLVKLILQKNSALIMNFPN